MATSLSLPGRENPAGQINFILEKQETTRTLGHDNSSLRRTKSRGGGTGHNISDTMK